MCSKKQRLTELLGLLGLTACQADFYYWALEQAEKQNGAARLPGCAWGSLPVEVSVLQSWGLLLPFKDSSGEVLVRPIAPHIATRAIFTKFLWQTCYSEDDVASLDPEQQQSLASKEALCHRLEQELKRAFGFLTAAAGVPPTQASPLRMIPRETVSEELAMHLLGAKHQIRGVTAPRWAPGLPLVWEAIKNRRSCGVQYRRLADELTFASFGLAINRRDVERVGVALRVAPRRLVGQKFFIVDDEAVFVFWDRAPGDPFPLKASITSMPAVVQKCVSWFDTLWSRAVPAESLFAEFEGFRGRFVATCRSVLGESGEEVGNGLVDYGRFYFDGNEQSEVLRALLDAGCVETFPERTDIYVPELVRAIEARLVHIDGPEAEPISEVEEDV